MNAPQPAQRSTAAVVVQSLMWLWLIFLSVLAALGYQALSDQADQERLDSRLQRLEAQATGWPRRSRPSSSARPSRRTLTSKTPARFWKHARPRSRNLSVATQRPTTSRRCARRSSRSRRAKPPRVPPHPPSGAHRARPPPPRPSCRRCHSASSAPNCAPASAACPSRRASGTSRPPNFRCCCPGMRSARGACRRSRATPQCSRPATRPAAWRFPDRSTP